MLSPNRVTSPFPDEPLIVFSGAFQAGNVEALRRREVDALMVSFDNFKTPKRWDRFHAEMEPLYDSWPCRRYLDSGVYALMRRAGVSRAKVHLAAGKDKDPKRFFQSHDEAVAAFDTLSSAYLTYLTDHHQAWDHIVELDVDQVMGTAVTLEWRARLRELVGDKLMPVWHVANGPEGWADMVADYCYVAIGGDAGVGDGTLRSARTFAMYREMVRYAHQHGTAVQAMGDTRLTGYLTAGWDSGDSTSWLTSAKWGQVGHEKLSATYSPAQSPQANSKARSWIDYAIRRGLDPDKIIQPGTNIEKLLCWVIFLQDRQAQVRAIYRDRGHHIEPKRAA